MTRGRLTILAAAATLTLGAVVWRARPWLERHGSAETAIETAARSSLPSPAAGADYTGSAACASCHRDSYRAWQSSQHQQAMQPAATATVKGRFDGAQFRYEGVVSTFFQRDGRYWVRTDGADGTLADFEIKYTFGVSPLQQYLIELPRGRVQALSIAWDTRPKSAGGQRWLHLYPGQQIGHGDELHWTQRQQNWNFMCADCHSTNLRKNYDAAGDSFRTTWSEISVGCEACHGPGARHVTWGQQAPSARGAAGDNGLTVHLRERNNVAWTIDPATMRPVRSTPRTTSHEIDTCAQCHSRRAQFADGYFAGARLLDFYEPATLEPSLFHVDGQQLDEVYTYGSFVQSRMAHSGVTCSDCHEPHAGTLRAAGNALCTQCHAPARYDAPAHHRHRTSSAGAQCVECHMPARTYMQIDARRDHSLRVPRPDLTLTTGTPNACTACHANRGAAWAANAVKSWLGRDATGFQDFARAFDDSSRRRPGGLAALLGVATSEKQPPFVRASAFDRLGQLGGAPASALASGLRDADPLVRQRTLRAFETAPPPERPAHVAPLLSDPVRAVRIAAARLLAPVTSQLVGSDRSAFDRADLDVVAAARFNADRPEARVSLGVYFADQNRTAEAEAEYRAAIRLAPDFPPGYVNLAELLRQANREADAERVFRDGLVVNPKSAELHYALGLSLIRSRRGPEATGEFKLASDLAPQVSRFAYGYALALNESGQSATAIRVLSSALDRHPDDREILFALASIERDTGQLAAARQHAAQLVEKYPGDREGRALLQSLR